MTIELKHFKVEEFACNCCGFIRMDDDFLTKVDNARDLAEVPFVITSGYRCGKHNTEVGSTSSNHTRGKAADIFCKSGPQRLRIVWALLSVGFRRLGVGPAFIHVDSTEGIPSIWLY